MYAGQFISDKYNGVGRLIIGATGCDPPNAAPFILERFLSWSLNTSGDRGYDPEHSAPDPPNPENESRNYQQVMSTAAVS